MRTRVPAAAAALVGRFRRQRPLARGIAAGDDLRRFDHAAGRRRYARQPDPPGGALRRQRTAGANLGGAAGAGRLACEPARGTPERIPSHGNGANPVRGCDAADLRIESEHLVRIMDTRSAAGGRTWRAAPAVAVARLRTDRARSPRPCDAHRDGGASGLRTIAGRRARAGLYRKRAGSANRPARRDVKLGARGAGHSLPALHGRIRTAAHGAGHGPTLEPESAFVVRTLLLHEFRKVHLRDPLLPAPLLAADWAGFAAYELCRDLYARVFQPAQVHLATHARRLRGPLPSIDPATYARFGGLARAGQQQSAQ